VIVTIIKISWLVTKYYCVNSLVHGTIKYYMKRCMYTITKRAKKVLENWWVILVKDGLESQAPSHGIVHGFGHVQLELILPIDFFFTPNVHK
jgi:hypothetical protein